jgi:hypothetical protein
MRHQPLISTISKALAVGLTPERFGWSYGATKGLTALSRACIDRSMMEADFASNVAADFDFKNFLYSLCC